MGWIVALIGGLAGLFCLAEGMTAMPTSAPQQLVQELYFVRAFLGLIVFAIGIGIIRIDAASRWHARRDAARDAVLPEETKQCPDCRESVGAHVKICRHCSHDFDAAAALQATKTRNSAMRDILDPLGTQRREPIPPRAGAD